MTITYVSIDPELETIQVDFFTPVTAVAIGSAIRLAQIRMPDNRLRVFAYKSGGGSFNGIYLSFAAEITAYTAVDAFDSDGNRVLPNITFYYTERGSNGTLIYPVLIATDGFGNQTWWIRMNPDMYVQSPNPYTDPWSMTNGVTPPTGYESGIPLPGPFNPRILTSSSIPLYDAINGTIITTVPSGQYGVVIGGSSADGWMWVDFDDYPTGWIINSYTSSMDAIIPASTTPGSTPGVAPTLSAISAVATTTGATIQWTTDVMSDGEVEYGTSSAYGTTEAEPNPYPGTSHQITISGLTQGTVYHYKVSSSASGFTTSSLDMTFQTGIPPSETAPTISNIAEVPSVTSAEITWDTNKASVSRVEYGPTNSYGLSTEETTVSGTSQSVEITGLDPTTTYHYRAYSRAESGLSTYSADGTFTTHNISTAASCDMVTADINPVTKTVTGEGSGSNSNEWRVIRVADELLLATGTGTAPEFSFPGRYNTLYQLQFLADLASEIEGEIGFEYNYGYGAYGPACENPSVSMDSSNYIITGTANGIGATEWRVIRESDSVVMDGGAGDVASFSFVGELGVQYKVQFK